MLTRRVAAALVALVVVSHATRSFAQRSARSATMDGVRAIGSARQSSTGSPPRWPEFELQNHSGAPRVVRVISLVSIEGSSRRSHRVTAPTTIALRPSQSRTVELHYVGTPNDDGVGAFTFYRFHITLEVDGHRATIESTSAYVCRIPIRR